MVKNEGSAKKNGIVFYFLVAVFKNSAAFCIDAHRILHFGKVVFKCLSRWWRSAGDVKLFICPLSVRRYPVNSFCILVIFVVAQLIGNEKGDEPNSSETQSQS